MNFNPLPFPHEFTDPNESPDELALQEGDIAYVYADTKGIPTIGIGLNLQVAQNMAVVLSQIAVGGLNLLEAAAQQGQTVAQVVTAFENVLTAHKFAPSKVVRNANTPASTQEQALSTALDSLAAQYFGISAIGDESAALVFENDSKIAGDATFANFPSTYADSALALLITDVPTSLVGGSGTSSYGPYAINTYSQQLTTWLTNNTNSFVGPGYDVPVANVPPVNSGQWEALLSLFFNQDPSNKPLIGKGLMSALQQGNVAQAWYQIRYSHKLGQSTTRRYQEAQMFGLAEPGDSVTQAIQAFEMLQENRATIVSYEGTYGTNPNTTGDPTQARNQITVANNNVAAFDAAQNVLGNPSIQAPLNPVLTLSQAFLPAAELLLTQLNTLLSNVTGGIGDLFDTTPGAVTGTFNVRSTDILIAPDGTDIGNRFANVSEDDVLPSDSRSADHLIIGADGVSSVNSNAVELHGGSGRDILIAGAGSELLIAGSGADTIIGGQGLGTLSGAAGNDTLMGGSGKDTFDFALSGGTALTETIVAIQQQAGVIEISSGNAVTVLGGSAAAQLTSIFSGAIWEDQSGATYSFGSNAAGSAIGTLTISGGSLGSGASADQILIQNFNLAAAESAAGFLGIFLKGNLNLTATADAGVDPPAPNFVAATNQSYTVSVDAPGTTPQTITMTLSGAPPSSFEAQVGETLTPLSASGTFTVTIPAGPMARSADFSPIVGPTRHSSCSMSIRNLREGTTHWLSITDQYDVA